MSTSTSIVSLAADLVVFLAAASFLLVLILRSDLLGVSGVFRAGLSAAATLLAAAAALFHGAGLAMDPADRREYERSIELVREQLSGDALEAAIARGRAMDADAALAYGLRGP